VFRGQFRHTVDPKGRVSIPAKFREALADGYGEDLVIVPNDDALEVHPLKSWQELEAKISALSRFDQDAKKARYKYVSRGHDVTLDPQGRIQIPAEYRTRAGLVKDVMVIGMIMSFEVWDVERWNHQERDNDGPLADLFERLASKGV
jgi:MraZ protein